MAGRSYAITDTGLGRTSNQDAAFAAGRDGESVIAVADGMGGLPGGDRASALAIASIERAPEPGESPGDFLDRAFETARANVTALAASDVQLAGMGTTFVAAIVRGGQAWLANVGDSRAYLWRDGVLEQITVDHSAAAEAVRAGEISAEQARDDPRSHMLTRVVGREAMEIDHFGPIAVDGECKDGTPEKPIEVYMADDAVLENPIRGDEVIQKELLRLARSYWLLAGVEVHPLRTWVGVVIGPDVRHVTIEAAHIYGGLGVGIVIEPGSEDITITGSHLHKLGTLGGPRSQGDTSGEDAGIRIYPGTRRIAVLDTRIHNVLGAPVEVVPPEHYAADPGLPPAAELTIDDRQFTSGQDKWW